MHSWHRLALTLCSLALPVTLIAQVPIVPRARESIDTLRAIDVSFDRILNTYLWTGQARYQGIANDLEYDVLQSFRSRLIRAGQRSVQDEYNGLVNLRTPVGDRWWLRSQIRSNVLSDSKSLDLSKLARHRLLGGIGVNPASAATVEVLGGYELNSQEDQLDKGFSYSVGAHSGYIPIQELNVRFDSQWDQALLDRKKPHDGGASLVLFRSFGAVGNDSLCARLSSLRSEFYLAADPTLQPIYNVDRNILTREGNESEVSDELLYRPAESMEIHVTGGILNRTIDRQTRYKNFANPASIQLDTRINELTVQGKASLSWRPLPSLLCLTDFSHSEREERHSVNPEPSLPNSINDAQETSARRLENISRWTTLGLQMTVIPGSTDSLMLKSSAGILRYDTPDSLNVDDRDELLIVAGVQTVHRLSDDLTLSLAVDLNLGHLVYLNGAQSANNAWNRVLRFAATTQYNPTTNFFTTNKAEVIANYTTYDFEEQVQQVRSYSFRQAAWTDSTGAKLTGRIQLDFFGSLRLFERGQLRWKEFKERPENAFVEVSLWPRLTARMGEGLRLSIGFRLFEQQRYKVSLDNTRQLEQRLQSHGPTVTLNWSDGAHYDLALEGWRETQQVNGVDVADYSNLSARVNIIL